ncbi:hypothetical protein ABZ628_29405 [Streptomyces diastaticus]|uniref:hypothetical protein n=1 Tax=Streptomyces diastaticus TaxID=1956 RepID=UPI0033FD9100
MSGVGYTLSLVTVAPILVDESPWEAYAPEAVATAIGNHPDFADARVGVNAPGESDTITAFTRPGYEYTLAMAFAPRPCFDAEEPPAPVADILRAAGQLRSRGDDNPDALAFDATAELLEHLAGTWDQQDDPTRQRAVALASALIL